MYSGNFQILFIGIVFLVIMFLVLSQKKYNKVILHDDNIRTDIVFVSKIVAILELIDDLDNKESELFLKGFVITQNVEDARYSENLAKLKGKIEESNKLDILGINVSKRKEEEYLFFIKFVEECYKKAMYK